MNEEIELWDGVIKIPKIDPKVEAFKADLGRVHSRLAENRQALLSYLRPAHDKDPTVFPFDEKRAWWAIEFVGWVYLAQKDKRKNSMPPTNCKRRFKAIEDAIWRLRREFERALREPEILGELTWAWFETAELEPGLYYVEWAFRDMVASLAALEERLHQAAAEVRTNPGARKSPKRACVLELACTFRSHTGKVPGTGEGPFARFVRTFFDSIECDKSDLKDVIDLIKVVRAEAQVKLKYSPFDKSLARGVFSLPRGDF